jgi:hypothetical protein
MKEIALDDIIYKMQNEPWDGHPVLSKRNYDPDEESLDQLMRLDF